MTLLDWIIVGVFNGAIIVYGLVRSRETKTSADWFLAGRTLPWWTVGLSLYATAIDSSDLVADSGGTYDLGVSYFVFSWVGMVSGWLIAAHFIAIPMYRSGMYTNAEYLEARFSPAMRVFSAIVQVLYRTLVLGIIATTIYLVLAVIAGWGETAWWGVGAIALVASLYTSLGGLKSVALTDALQTIVMLVGSFVLFGLAWSGIGGWSGLETQLASHDAELPDRLLHTGSSDWPVWVKYFIAGAAYAVVNHTQTMRLLGSRSEWHLKMSVVLASAVLMITTFTNLMIGVIGRAFYPETGQMPLAVELQTRDSIYPLLVTDLAGPGLVGLVVAGVVAAFISTYDSIGSTLSSLLVRDVYARFIVRDREDRHYLRVGQWLTPLIILGSFAYVPYLRQEQGMLDVYLKAVGAFVVPLFTIYMMGVFTRVHRRTGVAAIIVGVGYGLIRLLAPDRLPAAVLADDDLSYIFSVVLTAGTMLVISLFIGWERSDRILHEESTGWLRSSQAEIRELALEQGESRGGALPLILGLIMVALGLFLSFVIFW